MSEIRVAALYVETNGVYYGLPDVDPWDEARDARLYDGPWPVVAHPPCERWCQLAPFVQAVAGYKIGDDDGTFAAAVDAVRRFGGVLEHPAYSLAWPEFGIPRPVPGGWTSSFSDPGWTTEIAQSAYGHMARKRTWLYAVGVQLLPMRWNEPAVSVHVGDLGPGNSRNRGDAWRERSQGIQLADAGRTPLAFRDVLLDLARSASVPVLR